VPGEPVRLSRMVAARPLLALLSALAILSGCGPPSGGDGPSGVAPATIRSFVPPRRPF
jgi:hypothetical protein